MSTVNGEDLFRIGERLREERVRLGMSQETFGTRIGTTGRTIKKYEGSETSPRAVELLIASSFGLDVLYVVTGEKIKLSVRQDRPPYSPGERVAAQIESLKLTEEDAGRLLDLANRLAIK